MRVARCEGRSGRICGHAHALCSRALHARCAHADGCTGAAAALRRAQRGRSRLGRTREVSLSLVRTGPLLPFLTALLCHRSVSLWRLCARALACLSAVCRWLCLFALFAFALARIAALAFCWPTPVRRCTDAGGLAMPTCCRARRPGTRAALSCAWLFLRLASAAVPQVGMARSRRARGAAARRLGVSRQRARGTERHRARLRPSDSCPLRQFCTHAGVARCRHTLRCCCCCVNQCLIFQAAYAAGQTPAPSLTPRPAPALPARFTPWRCSAAGRPRCRGRSPCRPA
jgi:hypothetical protein